MISESLYEQMLEHHKSTMKELASRFQRKYMESTPIWESGMIPQVNYSILFDGYSVETNTLQTNYFDFLVHFELSIKISNPDSQVAQTAE